ncbi:MAG: hypothetical protein HYR58_08050 [Acidobacteria bacterium]|nr:hypothetical protein [Acidobacteriota bacterium]
MRRNVRPWHVRRIFPSAVLCVALCGVPVFAQQQPPENPPFPPLALPTERTPTLTQQAAVPPAPVNVPERVSLPAGTILNVVLETPLSTRIAKKDQKVTFRTVSPMRVSEGLELPPDTAIQGTVVEAKKPGGFGRAGVIRVKIDHVKLTQNASMPLVARLQSADTDKQGRIRADSARGTDLVEMAQYTLTGTLLGARIGGGKGAGIGAGAGALAALIIMMSRRGPDVYLEPGMPFVVVLDEPVELPGQEVLNAQVSYAKAHPEAGADPAGNGNAVDATMTIPPNERPVLKRRPKRP